MAHHHRSLVWAITIALVAVGAVFVRRPNEGAKAPAPASAQPQKLGFNESIQPILSENCYQCHGPDAASRKGELRLDRAEFAFLPRKGGAAIVQGQPQESLLVRRIESTKASEVMPPPESHKSLKPEQVTLLKRWIAEGAEYQEHWAFIKPERSAPPEPRQKDWAKNAIDRFVLARLEHEGLTPSPEADRYALIRRTTFDLTGLPPTPEETAAFLADPSPGAYERVVDRLLASPRYGEHRARYWLDAARYSDTHGLHIDNFRLQWPYRDYVIKAFTENKRFNQFAVEQIAGDLLPVESFDQVVATGFNRAHQTTSESGEITEELQFHNVSDRVSTVSTVFLGLTSACATCHDHKFDPLSQKEFYQLSAFFNNSMDPPFDDEEASFFPTLTLPPADKREEAGAILAQRATVERKLFARAAEADKLIERWLASADGRKAVQPVATEKLLARFRLDEGRGDKVHNRAPGAATQEFTTENQAPFWGEQFKFWPVLRLATTTQLKFGQLGDFESTDAFTVSGWFQPRVGRSKKQGALLSKMSEADKNRGWDIYWDDGTTPEIPKLQRYPEGRLVVNLIHGGKDNAITVRALPRISRLEWAHLAFSYDGSGKASGLRLYLNGERQPVEVVKDALSGSIRTSAPLQLGRRENAAGALPDDKVIKVEPQALPETSYQDIRVYARRLDDREIRGTMYDDVVSEIVSRPMAEWTEDGRKLVTDFFLKYVDAPSIAWRAEKAVLDEKLASLSAGGVKTLVMQEKKALPMSHVLDRGVYNRLKERVTADVPHFLPPLPPGAPRNRLGLAQWLVSPENPLVARVTVNRMWQEIFGTGIVSTLGDFGIVGARPSHFRLLDWLAVDFQENGWEVKRFYKQLVMSATYRQSAAVTPALLEKDPANRLLARGPRFRLDAEAIRDSALAAGGLLVERIGGPSMNTYQPPGLWEVLSMDRSNTRTHQRDIGDGLYRRSLYTFWKRFGPPPVLTTFDAPQRDVCIVQRERTNTPLQALITLNAPDFLEAARHLATRALRQADSSEEQKIAFMAAAVLTRPLAAADRNVLLETLGAFRRDFSEKEAREFLAVGDSPVDGALPVTEQAAWTVVASQLLNTDQAFNK